MSQHNRISTIATPPIVSIITPTYNRAHLLPRVWNSLRQQTLQAFQWIVVDDGSTDNTKAVIASFNDPRICYVYQANAGVNSARNRGEREIQGDFVVFLDSDDELYARDTLETMVGAIRDARPEIGMVYFTVVDSEGRKGLYHMESDVMEVNYIDHICEQRFWGEFFPIYRREVLSIAPWPPYSGLEALRHWRLAQHCPALLINRPARIYHRKEGDNLTSAVSAIRRAPSMAQAILELIKLHKAAWLAHCPCQLGRYLFYAAMYQALAGQTREAARSAIAAWPTAKRAIRAKIAALLASLVIPTKVRQHVFLWRARSRDR